MIYCIKWAGASRSFPERHAFLDNASVEGDCLVYLGECAGNGYVADRASLRTDAIVAIELKDECLGVYTNEAEALLDAQHASKRVFGFARFRFGKAAPTQLIELVVPREHDEAALQVLKALFENAGFVVATCNDFPGRIVNRLIRPYYNAVLRRYDEKLATAEDLDTTLKLGLGYPEGPLALLDRTGLAEHADTTQALYEALGDPSFAPARLAANALLAASGKS
jgi:3-hydroxybutyryl-CoA dehydrogenase